MSTPNLELSEPGGVRPELPIPSVPVGGLAKVLRRAAVGSGDRSFRQARQVTLGWLVAVVCAVIASRVAPAGAYATTMLAAATVVAAYAVVRVIATVAFERRQHAFESDWLAAQSQALRRQPFEVVRFSLQVELEGSRSAARTFDLTDPDDVRRLLDQQAVGRGAGAPRRVHVEFSYLPESKEGRAVERVRRELADLEFHPMDAPVGRAWVRFPDARYVPLPEPVSAGGRWPGRAAHWFLTGLVRLTTARPSHPAPPPDRQPR